MSGGPLTFGPDNVLFIADNTGAKIVALELGDRVSGGTPGTKDVPGIDQKIAALLGTDAREIQINDLAISATSKNAFISVSRGRGANAMPVLLRVDGVGKIDVISLTDITYTKVALPNAPEANRGASQSTRLLDHRHGVCRRPAVHRGAVERGVLVKAAVGRLPVQRGGRGYQRRDLACGTRTVRDPLPGLHLRAV